MVLAEVKWESPESKAKRIRLRVSETSGERVQSTKSRAMLRMPNGDGASQFVDDISSRSSSELICVFFSTVSISQTQPPEEYVRAGEPTYSVNPRSPRTRRDKDPTSKGPRDTEPASSAPGLAWTAGARARLVAPFQGPCYGPLLTCGSWGEGRCFWFGDSRSSRTGCCSKDPLPSSSISGPGMVLLRGAFGEGGSGMV